MASCDIQAFASLVLRGDIETCIEQVSRQLLALPLSPFHIAASLDFTNRPKDIARHIQKFISAESRRLRIEAVYAEMNGFAINPDRWFFDLFAYETHGGHDDYDWLLEWPSRSFPDLTLTGMEALQRVYASSYIDNKAHRDAADHADFLVLLKFQKLMKISVGALAFPLLATAHDYDVMYEHPAVEAERNPPWWRLW